MRFYLNYLGQMLWGNHKSYCRNKRKTGHIYMVFTFLCLMTFFFNWELVSCKNLFADEVNSGKPINHPATYPESYINGQPKEQLSKKGEKRGYPANTLYLKDHEFSYVDMEGLSGEGDDFNRLVETLNSHIVITGKNGLRAVFGHYNHQNLSSDFQFTIVPRMKLIEPGSIAIITDKDGYSKGYEFTNIFSFVRHTQQKQYYNGYLIPSLVFDGTKDKREMIYLQYCRGDIVTTGPAEDGGLDSLLIANFGYRIW